MNLLIQPVVESCRKTGWLIGWLFGWLAGWLTAMVCRSLRVPRGVLNAQSGRNCRLNALLGRWAGIGYQQSVAFVRVGSLAVKDGLLWFAGGFMLSGEFGFLSSAGC
ncbi:MAG: hypothetical protein RL215_1176 [Planctomycetota bacterium]